MPSTERQIKRTVDAVNELTRRDRLLMKALEAAAAASKKAKYEASLLLLMLDAAD